ncbi:hypothetical protein Tco_0162503 [Tanacetum coccineum]
MASKEGKSTTRKIRTNDQGDYYSGITSITVNGKNVYELKRKFLDDLHKNALSGTHGEDAVEHIEYCLKIVDPINLPNVNQDKLRIVVFPISLAGDAWRWFDRIKGLITRALWEYWKLGSDKIKPTNEETANLDETNHDNEQKIGEIFRIETNLFDYETPLCEKFKEFNYLLKIEPGLLTKDIEGFKTYEEYKDDWIYEWNENVPWVHEKPWTEIGDNELKDEALRNKAIMEGLIDEDDESSNNGWRKWDGYEIADHDQEGREYENGHEDMERCELFDDHEFSVCYIRRFKMIKYSFGDDEEYVAIKEDEYDDLTSANKDACQAYQEIFRMMDEGWMDHDARKEIDEVGEVSIIWSPMCDYRSSEIRMLYADVVLIVTELPRGPRQILDSRGTIPSKTVADVKVAIQEMVEYSQKYHNETSRARSTETSDGLVAIQAQLNNLGREIKNVNEKVYAAQVGCKQCKGPHYTKDYPLKEEEKTLEEAYYTQLGAPFQGGGYKAIALMEQHESFIPRTKMSKVLQERGFVSLPSSTETNPRDHVKSISTIVEADSYPIRRIGSSQYVISILSMGQMLFPSSVPDTELVLYPL